jgi:putative MATE family efflux protein
LGGVFRRVIPGVRNAAGEDLRREVLRLAVPAILELMTHTSIWMVDTAVVGRLGADALSAVGLGGQVFATALWVFAALGKGAVPLIGRPFGAGDAHETSVRSAEVVSTAAAASLLLFAVVRSLIRPLSGMVAAGEPARSLFRDYLHVMSFGSLPVLVAVAGGAALRSTGDSRTPMFIALISNVFNAVADVVLVFGLFGFPRLEVRGAAIASVASMYIASVLTAVALARGADGARLRLSSLFRWRGDTLRALLVLSAPAALETLLMDGARSLQMLIMTALGSAQFAAHQVALACESLSFMPGYGFAVASGIIAAQSLGGRRPSRARAGTIECLVQGCLAMGAAGLVFLVTPRPLVSIFTSESSVVRAASAALRIAGPVQPLIAATDVLNGALTGAGDTRTPMFVTALGAWLLRVPLTYVVVRVLGWPLVAVWVVNGADWAVRAYLTFAVFRSGRWADSPIPADPR